MISFMLADRPSQTVRQGRISDLSIKKINKNVHSDIASNEYSLLPVCVIPLLSI